MAARPWLWIVILRDFLFQLVGDVMRDELLAAEKVKAIEWRGGTLRLLDQRALPHEETWLSYDSAAGVAEAIRSMVVRGAPAIGIAAAFGVVLAARARLSQGGAWQAALEVGIEHGRSSHPVIGALVDADMEEASARLQALQTQQQLGIQALSIANQQPQNILALFQ